MATQENGNNIVLVLGNGFDLHLGYKTKYSHFFEWRKTDSIFSNVYDGIRKYHRNPNIDNLEDMPLLKLDNFWELFFIYESVKGSYINTDPNWCDIEKSLLKFICGEKPILYFDDVKKWRNYWYQDHRRAKVFSEVTVYSWYFHNKFNELYDELTLKNNYYAWLLCELKKFESLFALYLNQIIKLPVDYNYRATDLLSRLVRQELYSKNVIIEKPSVYTINFNYSCVGLGESLVLYGYHEDQRIIYQEQNVHGMFGERKDDDEIIFGVDDKILFEKKDVPDIAHMFSKTYRRLSLTDTNQQPLPKNADYIIFYGHSLSDADYSYFQSIFDFYNIYESNTMLKFKYSYYPGKNEAVIRQETYDAVYKLMKAYGDSFGDSSAESRHGKNLLHKLLLEGRISIELVD
jgi:hypothetical protein